MTDYPRWESVVVSDPRMAWGSGPPNQLVLDCERRGEDHLEAALRVKREEFRRLNPRWYAEHIVGNVTEKVSQVPVTETVVTETKKCETCDEPHAGYGKNCPACRKRSQRG